MKKKSSGAVLSLVTILAIILSLAGLALLQFGTNSIEEAAMSMKNDTCVQFVVDRWHEE